MSEVTFAKAYLATLDKRPIKLPADHAGDPRKYPTQSPFILPKQTHPFPQRSGPTSTQEAKAKTIKATLKPMRSGETVILEDITLDTTIHDLKSQYSQKTNQPQDKIKLLLNKKPTADLKTLKDIGVDSDVELSVMLMGGAAAGSTTPSATTPVLEKTPAVNAAQSSDPMEVDSQAPAPESEKAQMEVDPPETTTAAILKTEAFWTDLKGFLTQRLRDESEAERLAGLFREVCSKA